MALDFVALDFELANNREKHAVCEVGMVRVLNGQIVDRLSTLINPHTQFSRWCIRVHGIKASTVADAPTFAQVWPQMKEMLDANRSGYVVIHNRNSDIPVLENCLQKAGIDYPTPDSIDTLNLARGFMVNQPNYKLKNLCASIGYEYRAHHALDDAEASATLLLHIAELTHCTNITELADLDTEIYSPIIKREDEAHAAFEESELIDHPILLGHSVCVTGSFSSMSRPTAVDLIHQLGGLASDKSKPNANTTILVVGTYQSDVFAGHAHSEKHRLALERIEKGQPIEIMDEATFLQLLRGEYVPTVRSKIADPICQFYISFFDKHPDVKFKDSELRATSTGASFYFNKAKVAEISYTTTSGISINFNSEDANSLLTTLIVESNDPAYQLLAINPESLFDKQKLYIRNLPNNDLLFSVMETICFDQFDERIGCCNDFIKCSDAKECLHKGDIRYLGCYYRKNLEAGRIFYGKNKNI